MDLAHEFKRFRQDGDVAALARVFDGVAPDLLRLARALARDSEPPEDLVQSTFLTAIESRDTFDASRPLEPWLAGILANHVSNARRRAARQRNPAHAGAAARSTEEEPSVTDDRVIDREVWATIASAIDELPANYREVVAPRLLRGERAADIAARVGAPAGAIRMRLQRGVALLRRMLPRGISASIALFTLSRSSRAALATARTHVLGHASSSLGTAPALLASTGALIVSKKIALSFAVLALAAVGYVLTQDDAPDDATSPPTIASAPEVETPPAVDAASATAESTRDALGSAAQPNPVSPEPGVPDSYARALAGVRGRLLESDRSAVGNAAITLIELDSNSWISDLADSFRGFTIDPFVAESRTDAEGRFEFRGVFPRGIHALGIDLGGPRATLRIVDLPLSPGTVIELGDIVLGARGKLSGTVVDEDGNTVSNARVRATCLPAFATRLGLERLTEHSRILTVRGDESRVLELPDFVRSALARLPIPTTTTDSNGHFRLEGVPVGSVSIFVDHPRFVPRAFGPKTMSAEFARSSDAMALDVGALEISLGRSVKGRVLDAGRQPIANAIVIGGTDLGIGTAMFSSDDPIFANVEAVTDPAGRFQLDAIPEEGRAVFAARSELLARWTILVSEDDAIEIVLAESLPHEFQVSRADGVPVESIELRVGTDHSKATGLEASATDIDVTRCLKRERTGVFSLNGLAAGKYRGLLRTNGDLAKPLGPYAFEFEIAPDITTTKIVVPEARRIEVRVRESGAQSAVEHASVAALLPEHRPNSTSSQRITMGNALVRARTDVRGVAILDGIAVEASEAIRVRVDHPRYGSNAVLVEPNESVVEVILTTPGSLLAHLRTAGTVPSERYTAMLLSSVTSSESFDSFSIPQLTNSDGAGDVRLYSLAPGEYEYEIVTDALSQDLGALAARATTDLRRLEPEVVARGTFLIVPGQQTEITIEIAPRDAATNATLSGTITDGGEPLAFGMVMISPNPTNRVIEIDANGRYEAKNLPAGPYRVEVYDGAKIGDGVMLQARAAKSIELGPGQNAKLDFTFETRPVSIHVEQDGSPVSDVLVEVTPTRPPPSSDDRPTANVVSTLFGSTDSAGDIRIRVSYPGEYEIFAHHDARGFARQTVELRGDGNDAPIHLQLDPGATLVATYEIDEKLGPIDSTLSIAVQPKDGLVSAIRSIPIDPQHLEFRCEHLPPGQVEIYLQRLTRSGRSEFLAVVSKRITVETSSPGVRLRFEPDHP